MTGYRVGLALALGFLLGPLLGCGLLSNQSQTLGLVAPTEETRSIAIGAAAPALTLPPEGQLGSPLTPAIRLEPTSTPTAVRTLAPAPENAALSLLILHTNDTRGYLDPCG